jgi:hypothetical protein
LAQLLSSRSWSHYLRRTQLADQYQALLDSARTLGSRGSTPHHDLQTLQQMLGTAGNGADLLNNVIMHGGSAGTRHTGSAGHPKQAVCIHLDAFPGVLLNNSVSARSPK